MSELIINTVRKVQASKVPSIFVDIRLQCYEDGEVSLNVEPGDGEPELQAFRVINRVRRLLAEAHLPYRVHMRFRPQTRQFFADCIRFNLRKIKKMGRAVPITLFDDILPFEVLQRFS